MQRPSSTLPLTPGHTAALLNTLVRHEAAVLPTCPAPVLHTRCSPGAGKVGWAPQNPSCTGRAPRLPGGVLVVGRLGGRAGARVALQARALSRGFLLGLACRRHQCWRLTSSSRGEHSVRTRRQGVESVTSGSADKPCEVSRRLSQRTSLRLVPAVNVDHANLLRQHHEET